VPNQYTHVPAEERADATVHARRQARYKAAENRIKKIVDGAPPLTDEQRDRLALLLRQGADAAGGSAA
jgi:hypothetical protein